MNQNDECGLYYMMTGGSAGRISFGKKVISNIPANMAFVVEYAPNKYLPMDEVEEKDYTMDKWMLSNNTQVTTLALSPYGETTSKDFNLLFSAVYNVTTYNKIADVDIYVSRSEFEHLKKLGTFVVLGKLGSGGYFGFIMLPRTAYYSKNGRYYSGATDVEVKESTAKSGRRKITFPELVNMVYNNK